jgi:ABC-type transporter Mla maintaining outer membrane lipid asymmetry permease subunit MlaE
MVDALWVLGIAVTAGLTSYLHRVVGLLCVALIITAGAIIFGISGGSTVAVLFVGLPAIVGFTFGRIFRRRQEKV